ncbi:MAG: type 1 glutamine amidotransferase [Rhodanobacter sp.]|jgi:GMP synthase-like glutamine amidotransferase
MTQRLIVLQHHPAEGVGEIAAWAARRGVTLDIHRADRGQLPAVTHHPCLLLGGPHAVNHAPAWLERERVWLRERIVDEVPVFGICLGAQLLADALGATIHALNQAETGWTGIHFSDGSAVDALQWHTDSFSLPPDARSLAWSECCAQQMFASGTRHLGVQFHPEWNAALVGDLNAYFGDESPLPRHVDEDRFARVAKWLDQQLDEWWPQ